MKEGLDSPKTVVSILEIAGHDAIEAGPPGEDRRPGHARAHRRRPGARARRTPPCRGGRGGAATPQIRHMATLGGNLCQRPRCWYYRLEEFDCRKKGGSECFARDGENRFHAIFDTDLICCCIHPSATGTALLAYGATLDVVGPKGSRALPIDKFFFRPVDDADAREHARSRARSSRRSRSRPRPPGPARSTASSRRRNPSTGRSSRPASSLADRGRRRARRPRRLRLGRPDALPLEGGRGRARGRPPGDELARRAAEAAVARREAAQPRTRTRSRWRRSSSSARCGRPGPERRPDR